MINLLVKEQGAGMRIWIAAGVKDMRRGFQGLAAQVQTALEQLPYSGHIFIFRGRRGDMVKMLWFDGDGLCLFQKRLERGRFVWPQASSGTVSLSRAQLSMLLEGSTGAVNWMTNGSDFSRINPVAKSTWRNAQVLGGFGNPEVNRQLFHFGAPNPYTAEVNMEWPLPNFVIPAKLLRQRQ